MRLGFSFSCVLPMDASLRSVSSMCCMRVNEERAGGSTISGKRPATREPLAR
jgi:hypothetical protein